MRPMAASPSPQINTSFIATTPTEMIPRYHSRSRAPPDQRHLMAPPPRQYPSAKDRTGPDYQARPRRSMSPSGHSSSGKDRLLNRIDGQVDRPRTRCADRGNTGLPDTGKTGNHDEMPGHATSSGAIAATVSLSARRSNRSA